MGVGLPPLEFTECISDSPNFRENLHKHEKELENTNQQIKKLIKEVKELMEAAKRLSTSQKSFAKCLQDFTFEVIGSTQTDDERIICKSLSEFGRLINLIEDERDRMLEHAYNQVVAPLENFRKKHIGGVKNGKKKFDKQTAKFCQSQERYLNLTTKKQNSVLLEADASVDMAERHFYMASMDYVVQIQEVHERKKFEFVETLLGFMFSWLTFYHQGYEVAKDFQPYMHDLQFKIQRTRTNFEDYSNKLKKRMTEMQKQALEEPLKNPKGRKEGYLYYLEKKAFGTTTWTKHYCTYDKETKEFTMLPYNQLTSKNIPQAEKLLLSSCVRRLSDSIEKRFCFDLQTDSHPGVTFTFQALSETDRKAWLDIMDGKEPTYTYPGKPPNSEERVLDDVGIQFVKKCIDVLEGRGLEDQGIYRVVGVASKVSKLLSMGLDRRKDKLNLDDPQEWESKTITSALKSYLRNLPEPLMTHRYHNGFIQAVKNETPDMRVNGVHSLIYKIPKQNFDVLKLLIKHLSNVAAKSDKNLMTINNLGVCFGPTLLRPEEETVASIMDLKFYNVVVDILIENYQKIFLTEPDNILPDTSSPKSSGYVNINSTTNIEPISSKKSTEYFTKSDMSSSISTDSPDQYIKHNNHHVATVKPTLHNNQPLTCTIKTYIDPTSGNAMSSSMYNVHDPTNGSPLYNIPRNDHPPPTNGREPAYRQYTRFTNSNLGSQSETNIPRLNNYSPSNLRCYARLDANDTSSSNESVSSKEGGNSFYPSNPSNHHMSPEKSKRNNAIGMPYPKSYKPQGYVAQDQLRRNACSPTTFNRSSSSGSGVRRVRTLYACLGENVGELSFEPNQIITNVKSSQEPGWLEGTLNGKTGLIPENYVEMLP